MTLSLPVFLMTFMVLLRCWDRAHAASLPLKDRTLQAAFAEAIQCVAAWLSSSDRGNGLAAFVKADLTPPEFAVARWRDGYWACLACSRAGIRSTRSTVTTCYGF